MKEELLKGLTDEQIAKVKVCKNTAEILSLAKNEGIELTEEQLEAVSGGMCSCGPCPNCGRTNTYVGYGYSGKCYVCNDCKYTWDI